MATTKVPDVRGGSSVRVVLERVVKTTTRVLGPTRTPGLGVWVDGGWRESLRGVYGRRVVLSTVSCRY